MAFLSLMLRAVVLALLVALPALAQEDGFAPAATVNGRVISQYEVRQRVLMMSIFRQPGDISALALQSLIDDALRRDAARRLDVAVSPDEVKGGMTEFAARANLPIEKFLEELAKGGVAPETLRDFVEAGLIWRGVVRARFASATQISAAEIDRAIGAGAGSGGDTRVLLSEIILPTGGEVDAMALARRLKLTATTPQRFSMAAQDYSKAPTARAGGQLGWISVAALPPQIAPRILALQVGEVTEPIVMTGAVQLFLLRDISQGEGDAKGAPMVDYARFFAPAGSDLAAMRASLDTCDDLFDLGRALPPEALQRATLAEAGLPADLRAAVVSLDPGETAILSGSIVMLCSRRPASDLPPSRDDIANRLLNDRLGYLATGYLEELRANAIITVQ